MPASAYHDYVRNEMRTACAEMAQDSPLQALLHFHQRHDTAMAQAMEGSEAEVACRPGCAYCCHYKVVAHAVEIIAIRQYVLARLPAAEIKGLLERVKRNAVQAHGLSREDHLMLNQPCAFLLDGKCAVYPVRPLRCRSYHAREVAGCKHLHEHPQDMSTPTSFIPEVFNATYGMSEGFHRAIAEAGLDARIYDLSSAFLHVMKQPEALKRLKGKKKVFPDTALDASR